MHDPGEITRLLEALKAGDRESYDRLFSLVYEDLRERAHLQLVRAPDGQTLDTTALVHEAYVKLAGATDAAWHDRGHFFAVAAKAMRHILVDHARRRSATKRGGAARRVSMDPAALKVEEAADQILALDEALTRLGSLDERLSRVVELRFFGGLSVEETAKALDISERTVKRDWRAARAFLYRQLGELGFA